MTPIRCGRAVQRGFPAEFGVRVVEECADTGHAGADYTEVDFEEGPDAY
jgi:hypothetical protein